MTRKERGRSTLSLTSRVRADTFQNKLRNTCKGPFCARVQGQVEEGTEGRLPALGKGDIGEMGMDP